MANQCARMLDDLRHSRSCAGSGLCHSSKLERNLSPLARSAFHPSCYVKGRRGFFILSSPCCCSSLVYPFSFQGMQATDPELGSNAYTRPQLKTDIHSYTQLYTVARDPRLYALRPNLDYIHNGNTSPLPQTSRHICNGLDIHRKP